jgi:hypothetical protein
MRASTSCAGSCFCCSDLAHVYNVNWDALLLANWPGDNGSDVRERPLGITHQRRGGQLDGEGTLQSEPSGVS